MIRWLRSRLRGDEGVGLVTAMSISFTVAVMSATWYSIGLHELGEVSFDVNRTGAINMAEAGAREAMYLLANNSDFRDDADSYTGATAGVTAGACMLAPVKSNTDGVERRVGEYWYRALKADPSDAMDLHYVIEAWGWGPGHDSRQSTARKVTFEVELEPYGYGFQHALFASGGLNAGNRKDIFGDVYSGGDMTIGNYTRVNANDGGYPGEGNIEAYGDISITAGSNVDVEGYVKVNGTIDDRKAGTRYRGDVILLHKPGGPSYFQNATINQTMFVTGDSTRSRARWRRQPRCMAPRGSVRCPTWHCPRSRGTLRTMQAAVTNTTPGPNSMPGSRTRRTRLILRALTMSRTPVRTH